MKLIALNGKKQSGKDTIFNMSRDIFRYPDTTRVGRVAFADAIKHEVSDITGFRADFIEEHKEKFRSLLQVWGSDFRRQFSGDDYWINKMDAILEASKEHYDVMFITDCRFKNEAAFIKAKGGHVIRVERRVESYDTLQDLPDLDSHISENDMNDYSDFDYVINNDKTHKELEQAIKDMLVTLKLIENAT